MTTFLQLHLLTSYPPACLNRDDLNRPKTAVMGGVPRLRISSQSLKRAWRESQVFKTALEGHIGTQTKEMGNQIFKRLRENGVNEPEAREWSQTIAGKFGKLDNQSTSEIKQIARFSPEEKQAIDNLIAELTANRQPPTQDQLNLLRLDHKAVDISLFGRMLADAPDFNTEASCQVAHAITVHKVAIEDDFFTAVDDLNKRGSAHLGEQGFAAGLFYLYVCIDYSSLSERLGEELAKRTISALTETAATVAPSGKQNCFGSRASASYILAEKGSRQPRSLSVAFLSPIKGDNMLVDAIEQLEITRRNMDGVYYGWDDSDKKASNGEKLKVARSLPSRIIDTTKGQGDFQALLNFVGMNGGA